MMDGLICIKMLLDKRVMPSDCVDNDSVGEEIENVCENEKKSSG